MNAKTYLRQVEVLDQRIDSKIAILSNLKEMATKTTNVMSDVVVCRTRNNHSMEDVIVKIVDMQEQSNRDIDRLVDLKREIMERIHSVPDQKLQSILELHYICGKSWEDIAAELGCTTSNVFKMHARALQEIKVPDFDENFQ